MAKPVSFKDVAMGNIIRVKSVNLLTGGAYEDKDGFFIRAGTTGVLKYVPFGNEETEYIIKTFDASSIFVDPELCWKIFNLGVVSPAQASNVYVGYGL